MSEDKIDLRTPPLAVLSGGNTTTTLIDDLAKDHALAFLYPQVAQQTAQRGVPTVDMNKLLDVELKADAMNTTLGLMVPLPGAMDDIIDLLVDEMRAEGIRNYNAYEGVRKLFLSNVFQNLGQSAMQIRAWERVAQDFKKVSICITHEDVMCNTKTMCQFWRSKGVPTLHIPHAEYIDIWRGPVGTDVHDEVSCEWVATAGPYQRDWYIARGADPAKVRITGLPHWDTWKKIPDRREARDVLKLDQDKPVVAFMSSWIQATNALGLHHLIEKSYTAFLELTKNAEWQGVVKLHPGAGQGSADWHIKTANDMGASVLITPQYLDYVLAASDLIVSAGASNVVIEAALCGVPAVCTYGFPDDEQVGTFEPEDLGQAIEAALCADVDLGPFLAKYASMGNDGKGKERVLELVREIEG